MEGRDKKRRWRRGGREGGDIRGEKTEGGGQGENDGKTKEGGRQKCIIMWTGGAVGRQMREGCEKIRMMVGNIKGRTGGWKK